MAPAGRRHDNLANHCTDAASRRPVPSGDWNRTIDDGVRMAALSAARGLRI